MASFSESLNKKNTSSSILSNVSSSASMSRQATKTRIINLAKDIHTKSMGKSSPDVSSFPAFLWVVRDFTLQLLDKSGNRINAKEYLENALE